MSITKLDFIIKVPRDTSFRRLYPAPLDASLKGLMTYCPLEALLKGLVNSCALEASLSLTRVATRGGLVFEAHNLVYHSNGPVYRST